MAYRVSQGTDYQPVNLSDSDVMTMSEAARTLGLTVSGVMRAVERGILTEVIDDRTHYQSRRLILRADVQRFARSQKEPGAEQAAVLDAPQPPADTPHENGSTYDAPRAETEPRPAAVDHETRRRNDYDRWLAQRKSARKLSSSAVSKGGGGTASLLMVHKGPGQNALTEWLQKIRDLIAQRGSR